MVDVLVIEYDPEVREQAGLALNGGLFELSFASDGLEALKMANAKSYELILIDLLMPGGVSSLEVIKRLRRVSPASPLIAICEGRSQLIAEAARRAGAGEILFKPVTSSGIGEAAQKLLHLPALQHRSETPVSTPVQAALPEIALLAHFSAADKTNLLDWAEKIPLAARGTYQFDGQQGMCLLLSGKARAFHDALDLGGLHPGEVLGEASFFCKTGTRYLVTIQATEPALLYYYPKSLLRDFFISRPKSLTMRFAANVIVSLSQKLMHHYHEQHRNVMPANQWRVAEESGSALSVDSANPGAGSVFDV